MFTPTAHTAIFALAASAVTVNAVQSLSLKVTGPELVNNVENLKVTTTITNTGDKTLKLLNDPLSPLSQLPANIFKITGEAKNVTPSFQGIKAKFVPKVTSAYCTDLKPGKSINIEHDLSKAYDFTQASKGTYSFEAHNLFYAVDDSPKITTLCADGTAHSACVSGKLHVAHQASLGGFDRCADFVGCSRSWQTTINNAISAAQSYTSKSHSYLKSHTSTTPCYMTCNSFDSFTYDCSCTDRGVFAYVYPSQFGKIYLCSAFWQAPTTGTDSQGGTLIHEASHFIANGGTDNRVYGQDGYKTLAINDPDLAVDNADSYKYFTENNPILF
ncbi:Peptidyl-Lys metalloendopeptidase [Leucoagaricus sp. SymC.cos]|nr:Peptidyl-Lys metalloendopeptidase [Leucoagaricus sp. SymC.cos]